jgi:hypothetical protein
MQTLDELSRNFFQDIDRIDPYVKINSSGRFYIDLRSPEHIGISFLGFQAMKALVARCNELLDQGILKLAGSEPQVAQGKKLADAYLLKPEHWFRRH